MTDDLKPRPGLEFRPGFDPRPGFHLKRDLRIERLIPAPVAVVWRCLAHAQMLRRWWVPSPVVVADMVIEATPGGRFFTHMILPDGAEHRVAMMIPNIE